MIADWGVGGKGRLVVLLAELIARQTPYSIELSASVSSSFTIMIGAFAISAMRMASLGRTSTHVTELCRFSRSSARYAFSTVVDQAVMLAICTFASNASMVANHA